ncbi:hypothetical protein NC652_011330 [Populus alba x Populus x berolinensis]|nr:hypothetical protein NC652_011330 [Populus alba x Populus x berolinensis]
MSFSIFLSLMHCSRLSHPSANEVTANSSTIGCNVEISQAFLALGHSSCFSSIFFPWERVVRAGLNVDIAPDVIANQLNVRNGALILQVPGNSLAAKAGLVPTTRGFAGNIVLGDIIVGVDSKTVKNKAGLDKVLDDYNVGDRVLLIIQRGSEDLEVPIILEEKS